MKYATCEICFSTFPDTSFFGGARECQSCQRERLDEEHRKRAIEDRKFKEKWANANAKTKKRWENEETDRTYTIYACIISFLVGYNIIEYFNINQQVNESLELSGWPALVYYIFAYGIGPFVAYSVEPIKVFLGKVGIVLLSSAVMLILGMLIIGFFGIMIGIEEPYRSILFIIFSVVVIIRNITIVFNPNYYVTSDPSKRGPLYIDEFED